MDPICNDDPNPNCNCRQRIHPDCKCVTHSHSSQSTIDWGKKEATILEAHLNNLPPQYRAFRGNLNLPPDSNKEDYNDAYTRFMRLIRKRIGTIEVQRVVDPTDIDQFHLDVTVITDSELTDRDLSNIWCRHWAEVGGQNASLTPIRHNRGWANYIFKTRARFVRVLLNQRTHPHVPSRVSPSRGFFLGTSKTALWQQYKDRIRAQHPQRQREVRPREPEQQFVPHNNHERKMLGYAKTDKGKEIMAGFLRYRRERRAVHA